MTFYSDSVGAHMIDVDALPWVPFLPYSDQLHLKIIKLNPINGEWTTLLRVPAGMEMPKHHHAGTVHVYTIQGAWRYKEHDWVSKAGSFVYETAASAHTPVAEPGEDVITLNIVQGDWNVMSPEGAVLAIENWKSMVDRYVNFCRNEGLSLVDVTSFSA